MEKYQKLLFEKLLKICKLIEMFRKFEFGFSFAKNVHSKKFGEIIATGVASWKSTPKGSKVV